MSLNFWPILFESITTNSHTFSTISGLENEDFALSQKSLTKAFACLTAKVIAFLLKSFADIV